MSGSKTIITMAFMQGKDQECTMRSEKNMVNGNMQVVSSGRKAFSATVTAEIRNREVKEDDRSE